MAEKFDFLSATDKPALLAFSTPEWLEAAKTSLTQLGYKVHTAATHSDFLSRFTQVRYQVVVVEERFAANDINENLTLKTLQHMPMGQRRHATIILLGDSFQTFTPMQAFQLSVHAVINSSELFLLNQLIEKAIADNQLFLHSYREAQTRVYSADATERH
jgi:CheY-like chemotaxis protein